MTYISIHAKYNCKITQEFHSKNQYDQYSHASAGGASNCTHTLGLEGCTIGLSLASSSAVGLGLAFRGRPVR